MLLNLDVWQSGQKSSSLDLKRTCFDDYWANLPSLSDGMAIDCFTFHGRMSLLKHLIFDVDPATLWERGDTQYRETHWLWGYACQMDWQHRSGRFRVGLGDSASAMLADRISNKSWWSYMNFCFSVCVFAGAQRAELTTLNIRFDEVSQDLIDNDPAVQKCIGTWEHLFRNGYQQYKDSIVANMVSDRDFRDRSFRYHEKVWAAHASVIEHSVGFNPNRFTNPVTANLLSLLPETERKFGLGWCRMVDILASCRFPTDLTTLIVDGAGFLPIQVVSDEAFSVFQENPSALSKIELMRYSSVATTLKLVEAPEIALYLVAMLWKRVVRTDSIRRTVPGLVRTLTHGKPTEKVLSMMKTLLLFALPRGVVEWSLGWLLLVHKVFFHG